ncbi:MAG TPA: ATP-binding protein [Clostridiales bacterium]|nr:ATP-binding protein [Clostridiales bacterium]
MAYSENVYTKAKEELDRRRRKAETELSERRSELILRYPELKDLLREMARAGYEAVKIIGMGADAAEYIEKLKKRNLEIQDDIKTILKSANLPLDYLEPHYTCENCEDTGTAGGRICSCYKELLKKYATEELCASSPLKLSSFEDFSLDYYPDTPLNGDGMTVRKQMGYIFDYCKKYAEDFGRDSVSLLMYGETGLGKTHLSLAIGGEAIKKGYGVVYGSAHNLLSRLENERFGRTADKSFEAEKTLLECDLLIIDDLGTEFSTQFTVAEIYNIINTRLISGLPTIINTNLSIAKLEEKYSPRVASRIIGEYQLLRFCGRDIRQLKRNSL